jgi:hypothetical protein
MIKYQKKTKILIIFILYFKLEIKKRYLVLAETSHYIMLQIEILK